MLKGRLGLAKARIPHADRHGVIGLSRGELCVIDGCLNFRSGGNADDQPTHLDQIPHQSLSIIMLGPGSSVTHDALRLLARHGTLLAAVGEDGVRTYTAPPLGPDRSDVARHQANLWANERSRLEVARRMYAKRLGEILPHRTLDVLRGIEGGRAKMMYKLLAQQYGVEWHGRHFDRADPSRDDLPNQAINHAAAAVQAAAALAVQSVGALPQLGFIHEDSGQSFVLDIADLFRDQITLPIAFSVAKNASEGNEQTIDRQVRRQASLIFRQKSVISSMITAVKSTLQLEDDHDHDDHRGDER